MLDADDSEFDRKREQRQKAVAFFERFVNPDGASRGGINEYGTPTDFKKLLESNLREILTERLEAESFGRPARAPQEPPTWQGTPYPGLRAFMSTEAAIFFGRGRETDALVAELRKPDRRFTAVIGASGSGKSSLVYAGLLPRLAESAIEGSADWHALCFKPGAFGDNPFLALAAALKPLLPAGERDEPIVIADALAKAPDCIIAYLDQALATAPWSARLVLFVDQSEELFAQATASHRGTFVDLLAEATGHPRVQVVLTMRADFLPQATRYPRLAALLQTGTFILGVPGPAALADMIRRPAQLAGLALDEDLADAILKDVGSEPGALPLVAFCLEALYRSSASSRRLTLRAYEDLGRLEGAIRGRAAETLAPYQQGQGVDLETTLSKLFRGLVHIDAAGAVSRRRAVRNELTTEPLLEEIVVALEKGRLLVAEGEPQATVSLAHEVLLSAWPELDSWVGQHRAQLQRLDRALSSLDSVNALDRTYGVQVLGEIGPAAPEAVPALIASLSDADAVVRRRTAEALVRMGPRAPEAVPALITALGDGDETVRASAASALGRIGAPAVPALIAALADGNETVRESAAGALWQIGPPAAPALITALANANEAVRQSVAEVLGSIEPPAVEAAVPALITALGDGNEIVRANAARALGQIGPPASEAVPALISALAAANWHVAVIAATALAQIGAPAVPALITALAETDELVRAKAVWALWKIGAPAVPALEAARGDRSEQVRDSAEQALRQLRSRQ